MRTPVTLGLMSGRLMSVHSRRVISLNKNGEPRLRVGALTLTSSGSVRNARSIALRNLTRRRYALELRSKLLDFRCG